MSRLQETNTDEFLCDIESIDDGLLQREPSRATLPFEYGGISDFGDVEYSCTSLPRTTGGSGSGGISIINHRKNTICGSEPSQTKELQSRTTSDDEFIRNFIDNGSTCSIQSAPPPDTNNIITTISTTTTTNDESFIRFINRNVGNTSEDHLSIRSRPISLAIDEPALQGGTSLIPLTSTTTTNNTATTTTTTTCNSELDDDDNDNLLTISSLTARPLIAKSRELRYKKRSVRQKFENKKEYQTVTSPESPPDGGYGWLVVFGAFSVQFWVPGLVKSYGVLFVEILETFPSNSTAVASWIPAILSALCLALAPLSSALCQRFSCRSVVFIGGLFCACGLTLSYFATSIYHLLFTFGILTGIGGGLSTTPGIIIVSLYFDKHRALANGICVSGTAAGSFVFPVLIEHLVKQFGFHGTLLILGVCMIHVCISAALYRPLESNSNSSTSSSSSSSASSTTGQATAIGHNTLQPHNKSPSDYALRTIGLNNATNASNITGFGSFDDSLNKKYIEHLFLEESKNRINDFYTTNKFVNVNDKAIQIDSDDEDKDIIGETKFLKPIKSIRSASILHSVEDLSTDSTCVYKARGGFDSNRGSRKRNNNNNNNYGGGNNNNNNKIAISADEINIKVPLNAMAMAADNKQQFEELQVPLYSAEHNQLSITSTLQMSANRGLSKSMIIPTPVSDFSENDNDCTNIKKRSSCCEKISRYLDISLLKDTKFIAMCLSVTLMSTGCPYLLYFLPAFAITTGYTKSEAGFLVTVSAALDLIGRLGCGYLSDLQIFDHKKAYIFSILGAGFAVLIIPLANSWYIIGSAAAAYGLCLGSWYLLMPVLLADMFGTERISSSYGLVRMFQSIGAISIPPFAGYLKDQSGGYEICFYGMGTCMVLGSLPLIIYSILHDGDDDDDGGGGVGGVDGATSNDECEISPQVSS